MRRALICFEFTWSVDGIQELPRLHQFSVDFLSTKIIKRIPDGDLAVVCQGASRSEQTEAALAGCREYGRAICGGLCSTFSSCVMTQDWQSKPLFLLVPR